MAVHAAVQQQEIGRIVAGQAIGSDADANVAVSAMTGLTEQWCSLGQHARVVRAMWLVAVGAVFGHRRMLPKVRAALVGVAGIAILVDVEIGQHGLVGRSMRRMAIAAGHFAVPHRVRVSVLALGFLTDVTVRTDLVLSVGQGHGITPLMGIVTVSAADFVALVGTAIPEIVALFQMAAGAHFVLLVDRPVGVGSISGHGRSLQTRNDWPDVVSARTVASLTLQLAFTKRRAFVGADRVRAFEQIHQMGGFRARVAPHALLRTVGGVFGRRIVRRHHPGGCGNQGQRDERVQCLSASTQVLLLSVSILAETFPARRAFSAGGPDFLFENGYESSHPQVGDDAYFSP